MVRPTRAHTGTPLWRHAHGLPNKKGVTTPGLPFLECLQAWKEADPSTLNNLGEGQG